MTLFTSEDQDGGFVPQAYCYLPHDEATQL